MKDISNIYKLYTEANHPELNLANAITCAINLLSDEEILNCKDIKAENPAQEELPGVTEPKEQEQEQKEVEIDMVKLNNALENTFYGDDFWQFNDWQKGRFLRNGFVSKTDPSRYTPVENDQLDTVIEILSIYISEENEGMKPEDIKASLKAWKLPIKLIGEDSGKIIRAIDIENALKSKS